MSVRHGLLEIASTCKSSKVKREKRGEGQKAPNTPRKEGEGGLRWCTGGYRSEERECGHADCLGHDSFSDVELVKNAVDCLFEENVTGTLVSRIEESPS